MNEYELALVYGIIVGFMFAFAIIILRNKILDFIRIRKGEEYIDINKNYRIKILG